MFAISSKEKAADQKLQLADERLCSDSCPSDQRSYFSQSHENLIYRDICTFAVSDLYTKHTGLPPLKQSNKKAKEKVVNCLNPASGKMADSSEFSLPRYKTIPQ